MKQTLISIAILLSALFQARAAAYSQIYADSTGTNIIVPSGSDALYLYVSTNPYAQFQYSDTIPGDHIKIAITPKVTTSVLVPTNFPPLWTNGLSISGQSWIATLPNQSNGATSQPYLLSFTTFGSNPGETLWALEPNYFVANPGPPVTNSYPVLSAIVSYPGPNSLLVNWGTDQPTTNNLVLYSTNVNLSNAFIAMGADGSSAHSVSLSGLSNDTEYFFVVSSTANGLSTTSAVQSNTIMSVLAWWRFCEGSGSNVNDSSSGNRPGILTGTSGFPAWVAGDGGNPALQFDGTKNEFVLIPNSTGLANNLFHFSVTAWVNFTSGATMIIAGKWDSTSTPGWVLYTVSGYVAAHTTTGPNSVQAQTGGPLNNGAWHFIAYTFASNGSTASSDMYVDGSNFGDAYFSSGYPFSFSNGDNITIGSGTTPVFPFTGYIEDVRIFATSLTPREISALYAAGPQ